jgi:uncharacterized protein YodC (DUF2158 family)
MRSIRSPVGLVESVAGVWFLVVVTGDGGRGRCRWFRRAGASTGKTVVEKRSDLETKVALAEPLKLPIR